MKLARFLPDDYVSCAFYHVTSFVGSRTNLATVCADNIPVNFTLYPRLRLSVVNQLVVEFEICISTNEFRIIHVEACRTDSTYLRKHDLSKVTEFGRGIEWERKRSKLDGSPKDDIYPGI